MRKIVIATMIVLAAFAVTATPAAAAPPDIGSGCGYFHWHNGDATGGELPGYHYHPCYPYPT